MDRKKYLVGLGNYAKNDDGIGLRLVEFVTANELDVGFEAVEIGNDGLRLLTFFTTGTARILVADCALMGKKPGDYALFSPDAVIGKKIIGRISTHEGDLLKLIALGRELGYPIPDLKVLAIEPESLEMEMTLSETLAVKLGLYAAVAVQALA